MQAKSRQRRSARTILLNNVGRVLLIRFVVPRDAGTFTFWATPGGEIEEGETDLGAAQREICEELHLSIPLTGPVHTACGRFEHEGVATENTDVFFVGRCHGDTPLLRGVSFAERAVMQTTKWWSADEIEASAETIFPRDLGAVVRHLA
jgi:8-oxo-dGTP diphosphatase